MIVAKGGHWTLKVEIIETVMIREIVLVGNPILQTKTNVVWRADKRVASVLDDLRSTVRAKSGAGLAAPQIGVGLAACVWIDPEGKIHELLNPKIVRQGTEELREYEACLSIPDKWGEVVRSREIWIAARDRNWKEVRWHLRGFSARVVQHEIDHLNGILFTERAVGKLLNAEEIAKVREDQARALGEPVESQEQFLA
jgi:peptide deformylase